MTIVSGNIRFTRIFVGVPWRRESNDSMVIENVDFQRFRTLRLRKWGQRYYIVLFSPLSPSHWPQNTWPWMTLNGHFTLKFHRYQQRIYAFILHIYCKAYLYNIFVVWRHQQRRAEAKRGPQNIWDPRKDCGSFIDEKLRALYRWNLEK